MVKPNILTHVIEGYVIQEAGEPFAVSYIVIRQSNAADLTRAYVTRCTIVFIITFQLVHRR